MDLHSAVRAVRQWVPFASRTMAYGAVSLTLGPLTRDRRASLWAMQRWCRSSARGLNVHVEVSGLENVPAAPFVYCSNHQSLLDILVLGSVLPGDFKWAAKRELMNIPFLGWHLRLAGHVPVDRKRDAGSAQQVIARFEAVLKGGKPLLIFPEGTRSEDGVLRQFKNGGFYAAVRADVPVVPVAVEGTYRLMKKGAIDTGDGRMRTVRVRIGKPVEVLREGRESPRVNDLRERTRIAVADLVTSLGGHLAAPAEVHMSDPPGPATDAASSDA